MAKESKAKIQKKKKGGHHFTLAILAGLVLGIVAAIAKPLQVDKKRSKLQNALNIHFPSLFLSVISGLFLFSGLNTIIALFQDLFC